jgi:hypothetical protein
MAKRRVQQALLWPDVARSLPLVVFSFFFWEEHVASPAGGATVADTASLFDSSSSSS